MRRVIQVFEHESLHARRNDVDGTNRNSDSRHLEPAELDQLHQFNDRNGHKYFTGIRNGIKFKSHVGVIQVGQLTLEVLPKSDRSKGTEEDYGRWQKALLDMLRLCHKTSIDSTSETRLRKRHNSILDLYFEMYINEVDKLLRMGLVKRYRRVQKNTTSLKGKLLFAKQIRHNAVHQERFFTEHQIYDRQNLINQIILKGLDVIENVSQSREVIESLQRTRSAFPGMAGREIQEADFQKLQPSRNTARYASALEMAKMFILNYSPDVRSGSNHMLAIMFDMNNLWEEYIFRTLLKTKHDNLRISSQRSENFWERRTIRPDIVIEDSQLGSKYVIDTKWKVLDTNSPKPSDDDLKQMFAYNLLWDASKSMLLYPTSNDSDIEESFGQFSHPLPDNRPNQCKLGFIQILDDKGNLRRDLGDRILDKFKEPSI